MSMTTATPHSIDYRGCFEHAVSHQEQIKTDLVYRAAYGSNTSHYDYTPAAAIIAQSAQEVAQIFAAANRNNIPVTLRAGGSSLSGQAASEGVIVDVRKHFKDMEILDEGKRVRVQPGLTIDDVNMRLALYGYKLGPDPASTSIATVGGVIANNSSGMACGTEFNSYKTLESLTFVLPSGTIINSADPDADAQFAQQEPALVDKLQQLTRRVRSNPESVEIIKRHFSIKNSIGYTLNSFLDFDSPVEQFIHLLVGSEGTLAFIAEAVFRTLPIRQFATTAMAVFSNLTAATDALPALKQSGTATLELLDDKSIIEGQKIPGTPEEIHGFSPDGQTGLIIEYHTDNQEELKALEQTGLDILGQHDLFTPASFFTDETRRAAAWKFRKSLYPIMAESRPTGTMALIEDIAVPVQKLTGAVNDMGELFRKYNYRDALILGHAGDGNLHFTMTDDFYGDANLKRYEDFTDDLVDLVLGYHGNLKAEHGTGRVMAPFVRRQYGDELYKVARELKFTVDPNNWMNPDVIITDDPKVHIKNLKHPEQVEDEIDSCVECGFCEAVCPSRDLTLTPRQRIVVRRYRANALAKGDMDAVKEIDDNYVYPGIQTCAVDSMCATACPVNIDTGKFIKSLRKENNNAATQAAWDTAAKNWGATTKVAARALDVAKALPHQLTHGVTGIGRVVIGKDTLPLYTKDLPRGGTARAKLSGKNSLPQIVGAPDGTLAGIYLPACVSTMFGPAKGGDGAPQAFIDLLAKAGLKLIVPAGIDSLCCGTPWSSKGLSQGHDTMAAKVTAAIDATLDQYPELAGLPVISDASSCTDGFADILAAHTPKLSDAPVTVTDSVQFAAEQLLPKLTITTKLDSIALHPTCSSTQMGINGHLKTLAKACAHEVHTPQEWHCCGFAGDRGMLHPELTASSTATEAAEVKAINADGHASCNRTCEIGLTRATGKPYRHVLEYLAQAVR